MKLHRDWATFQAFGEWYSSQPGYKLNWELDKDLLKPGNRVYGPKTCTLLPRKLNAAIRIPDRGLRLPGARKHNTAWAATGVDEEGKGVWLGIHPTEVEAHKAYSAFKEAKVKSLADQFKEHLTPEAYVALMNWTVAAYMI